jgi:spore germination protein GerM
MSKSEKIIITFLVFAVAAIIGLLIFVIKESDQAVFDIQATAPQTMTVRAYFNNSKSDPEYSCNKVFPVDREALLNPDTARAALLELLKGETPDEKADGFFTSLNPGVKIQSLSIIDGIARADFSEQLGFQVAGSCRVSAIRAQITETLRQFSTVKEVIISINGRTEDILQP